MGKIQRLDVENYRGIRRRVSLLFDGKSVLLFGENGSGKSSFVDALERLLSGKVSTLDGRAMGISSDRHGPHIRSDGKSTDIQVVFDDPGETVVSLNTAELTVPADVRRYLDAAHGSLFILRRAQLLEFVESQPKNRYEFLQPFVPIGDFRRVEDALRQAREKFSSDSARVENAAAAVMMQLRQALPGVEFSDYTDSEIVAAINRHLATIDVSPLQSVDDMPVVLSRIDQSLERFGDLSRYARLSQTVVALEELGEQINRIPAAPMVAQVEALRSIDSRESPVFYEAVLQQGERWIDEEQRETCPLCEQPIDRNSVIGRLNERLGAVRELVGRRRVAREALESARQVAAAVAQTTNRTQTRLEALSVAERAGLDTTLETVTRAIEELNRLLTADTAELELERLREWAGRQERLGELIATAANSLRVRFGDAQAPEVARRILAVREKLDAAAKLWPQIVAGIAAVKKSAALTHCAGRLFEHAQLARKEGLQQLFDELAEEINRIYCELHPSEAHGGVRLDVREVGQGSVNLRADFYHRHEEDPRAYYSEAHLDTLGLSIFLALRKWQRTRTKVFDLLVLDDVLTSVDAEHALRVAELVLSEFGDYQILITTHDRVWFEYLKDIQARCGVAQRFVNKAILRWSLDEGPDLRESFEMRETIDRVLVDGTQQEIAAEAGRLLEQVLQEMRFGLRLRVSAKRGERYEIGELWPAFLAIVKREYPSLYSQTRKTLEALDSRWPIRNWVGAHWNTWAQNVSRKTAVEFAEAVRDLFDSVYCKECRRFIEPSMTPTGQIACRGGHIVYPAQAKEPGPPVEREAAIRRARGSLRDAKLDSSRYIEWKRGEARRES